MTYTLLIKYITLFGGCLVTMLFLDALATPYIPHTDAEIIERLPLDKTKSVRAELRSLRQQLIQHPEDAALAANLARRYIEQARASGDPRFLGYAQASLAPWWDQAQIPLDILVLRAVVRQSNHEFDAALKDLSAALQSKPNHVQALLTRAAVLQVRGEFAAAKRDCLALVPLTSALIAYGCVSGVTSLTGQAQASYDLLQRVLERAADTSERQWAQGLLAEMAQRRGDRRAAEYHYRAALQGPQTDTYLLAAYADFLLDQGRAPEVIALLADHTRVDGLLLRLALAERAVDAPQFDSHKDGLRARYAAAQARGDVLHRREQARFELALENNPAAALNLAQANWTIQREPADARILLEAAIAAGSPRAARPVKEWIKQHDIQDVHLQTLVVGVP